MDGSSGLLDMVIACQKEGVIERLCRVAQLISDIMPFVYIYVFDRETPERTSFLMIPVPRMSIGEGYMLVLLCTGSVQVKDFSHWL